MKPSTATSTLAPPAKPDERSDDHRVIESHAKGGVWIVKRSWEAHVVGHEAPDFFALEGDPSATLLKNGQDRSAWLVSRSGANLFCKVYEPARGPRRFVRRISGLTSRREFRVAQAAAQQGVPVPTAIAWGRRTSQPYRTAVVLKSIVDAVPLSDLGAYSWQEPGLIDAVAALFAKAHNAGFIHRDGHPGNVLVRRNSDVEWGAWFVDLHAARMRSKPVSRRSAACALGSLEHYYAQTVSPGARLRFLARYLQLRRRLGPRRCDRRDARAFSREVQYAACVNAVRLARQRDRRLRRSGKYFARLDLGSGWNARVVLKLARRRIDPAPDIPDRTVSDWRGMLPALLHAMTQDNQSTTPSTTTSPGSPVLFRVDEPSGIMTQTRTALCGTTARRIFEHCHQLRHRDISAPVILGYAEHRSGGLIDTNVVILPDRPDPLTHDNHGPTSKRRNA